MSDPVCVSRGRHTRERDKEGNAERGREREDQAEREREWGVRVKAVGVE